MLRRQFDRFSVQALDEYAKLQICRLEAMIGKLSPKVREGDTGAVALALKAIDRLDRYHGFGKGAAVAPEGPSQAERRRVADKIERLAVAGVLAS